MWKPVNRSRREQFYNFNIIEITLFWTPCYCNTISHIRNRTTRPLRSLNILSAPPTTSRNVSKPRPLDSVVTRKHGVCSSRDTLSRLQQQQSIVTAAYPHTTLSYCRTLQLLQPMAIKRNLFSAELTEQSAILAIRQAIHFHTYHCHPSLPRSHLHFFLHELAFSTHRRQYIRRRSPSQVSVEVRQSNEIDRQWR